MENSSCNDSLTSSSDEQQDEEEKVKQNKPIPNKLSIPDRKNDKKEDTVEYSGNDSEDEKNQHKKELTKKNNITKHKENKDSINFEANKKENKNKVGLKENKTSNEELNSKNL